MLVLLAAACSNEPKSPISLPAPDYWPTQGWRSSSPEEVCTEIGVPQPEPTAGAQEVERGVKALGQALADAFIQAFLGVHPVAPELLTKSKQGAGIRVFEKWIQLDVSVEKMALHYETLLDFSCMR